MDTSRIKSQLVALLGAGLLVGASTVAQAHTVQVCWRCEANGDVTFFAGSYHAPELQGGIIVDGAVSDFTSMALALPGDVTECLPKAAGSPAIQFWLVVTVSGLSSGTHSVSTTATTEVESPWPGYLPQDVDLDCADATPPQVSCVLGTNSLWPPNHELVDVGFDALVSDDQDANPAVQVLVYSDEPEEDTADGNHECDAVDDGETLLLRAERRGDSDGRVYLIVIVATDASGNVGYGCCTVTVPHDKSKKSKASVAAQAAAAEFACLETGAPPAGFHLLCP